MSDCRLVRSQALRGRFARSPTIEMRRHPWLGLLLAWTLAACSSHEVDLTQLEASRHPAFDRADWLRASVLRRFEFYRSADLAGWSLGDWEGGWRPLGEAPHSFAVERGIMLAEPEARYWLQRELAPDERSTRKLIFETDGNSAGDLFTVCWRWPARDWTCEPITLPGDGSFTPEVAVKPVEGAALESVKFQLTTTGGRRVVLQSVELLGETPTEGALDPGPWRVTLGGETRDGFAARASDGQLGKLSPGPGTRWLGLGVSAETLGGMTFEVVARGERRERLLARYRVEGVGPQGAVDRWHDLALRLDAAADGKEEVFLIAYPDDPGEEKQGFVFWSVADPKPSRWDRRPDVLLISLDTVRADHMSLYGYGRPTTERLEAWAGRRAVIFEHAVAPAPWTLPSHASVFTGLDADRHGANIEGPLAARLPVLAELLRQAGYETRATTVGPVLAPEFGLDRGFARFRVRGTIPDVEVWAHELDWGTSHVLEWLREGRERRDFVFLHTYQAHDPHSPEQPGFSRLGGAIDDERSYVTTGQATTDELGRLDLHFQLVTPTNLGGRSLAGGGDERLLRDLYDSGLVRLDEKVVGLLQRIEEEGLAENLVVVLFSDHGESLLERGLAGHHHLYEDNLHVPLLLAAPGIARAGQRIATPVSLVDILPTVLELAGVEPPSGLDGISLVGCLRGHEPASRPVWSYAASSNRGFAVRRDAFEKQFFLSSAWAAGRARGERLRLDEDPEEERPQSPPPTEMADFGRQVARRIAAVPRAFRVELSNRSSEEFALLLQGEGAYPGGVESLSAPTGCCTFGRDWLRAKLVPGTHYDLTLVDRRSPHPELEIGSLRGPAFARLADGEANFVFDGRSWARAGASGAPGLAHVRLVRHLAEDPASAQRDAEEALSRLRALGYVN